MLRSEVLEQTRKLDGADQADLSYITDELVAADTGRTPDNFLGPDHAPNTVYLGNNARYGASTYDGVTYQGYWFDYSAGDPCGSAYNWFVTIDWHHTYLGRCPNGREKWSFNN